MRCMAHAGRSYDVFLSHAGGEDLKIKQLLDFLRRLLNRVPCVGARMTAAFLDEADLRQIGNTRETIFRALRSAPIGERRSMRMVIL